jgi:glycosyltransferase involved in cell wall biosynthesis
MTAYDDEGHDDEGGAAGHVLVIVENNPLCVDQRVRKQVRALLAAGHHVSVVTRRHPGNAAWQGAGLTVLEHPAPVEPHRALGYLREYAVSFGWATVLAVTAHHRRPVTVVQLCQPPDVYFPLAWLMRALGAAVVVDQRDLMPELFAARYGPSRVMGTALRWLERRTQRAADLTIGVNGYLRTRLEEAGARAPVPVVGNGPVLAGVDAARPEPAVRGGADLLGCWVGKMGRQDRVDLLVEAIAVLVHELGRRDCRFAVLGDGECLDALREQVGRLGIEAWVSLPGWLPESEVFTHLATADVGLDTSLQDEVSPVKAMEYMAFAVPVLAFDLPETSALVRGAGVAVPAGDLRRFAGELDALLDDPARRARLGREGRRRVVEELCWERQSEVYLSTVDRALRSRRARRPRPAPAAVGGIPIGTGTERP